MDFVLPKKEFSYLKKLLQQAINSYKNSANPVKMNALLPKPASSY